MVNTGIGGNRLLTDIVNIMNVISKRWNQMKFNFCRVRMKFIIWNISYSNPTLISTWNPAIPPGWIVHWFLDHLSLKSVIILLTINRSRTLLLCRFFFLMSFLLEINIPWQSNSPKLKFFLSDAVVSTSRLQSAVWRGAHWILNYSGSNSSGLCWIIGE